MLSSVLHSGRAVRVNIEIMRAFVRLRQLLASNVALARKLDALEMKYDSKFKVVFDAIRELMKSPEPAKKRRYSSSRRWRSRGFVSRGTGHDRDSPTF